MTLEKIADELRAAAENLYEPGKTSNPMLGVPLEFCRFIELHGREIKLSCTKQKISKDKVFWILSMSDTKGDKIPEKTVEFLKNLILGGEGRIEEMPSIIQPGITRIFIRFEQ